jgi:hypothetical protein
MPTLDYMVLADYVRQDVSGSVTIIGAGVDTVGTPIVPTVQPLGIALRLLFSSTEEAGARHRLRIAFLTADGQRLLEAGAEFATPPQPPHVPPHWKTAVGIALQIPVPLPAYGDYSFELDIDNGAITKSIDVRVVRPAEMPQPLGTLPQLPPAG